MSHRRRHDSARAAKSAREQAVEVEHRASPTPERMRRAGTDFVRGASGQITLGDSPLARSLTRGVITREQFLAAQKYRHHWYHSGLAERLVSPDLDGRFAKDFASYAGIPKSEMQLFHRQRYREAVQTIGKIGSQVLDSVVCRDVGLEQMGYALGWGTRAQAYAAAVESMKTALDALCTLWGIG
jgi:hypothetical protein